MRATLFHSTHSSSTRKLNLFLVQVLSLATILVQFSVPLTLFTNPTVVTAQTSFIPGVWHPNDWDACDASCGVGVRHRSISCLDSVTQQPLADTSACDPTIQPITTQTCQTSTPCPGHTYAWYSTSYNNAGYRGVVCIDSDTTEAQKDIVCLTASPTTPKPSACASGTCLADDETKANIAYFFFPTPWSACYPYCGDEQDALTSSQSRYYVCINAVGGSDDSSNQCWNSGLVPPSDLSAYQRPCPYHVPICTMYWKAVNRSPCNAPCGGGFDTITFACANITTDAVIPDSMCYDQSIDLPLNYESCNTQECLVKWVIGDYGQCSAKCGGGLMTRTVQCFDMNGMLQPDSSCAAMWDKPAVTGSCGGSSCSQWSLSSWSECSELICGGGTQSRTAACVLIDPTTGDAQPTPVSNCQAANIAQPPVTQQCNTNPCAKAFWDYSSWGACQGNVCGQAGVQTRKVQCSDAVRNSISESDCTAIGVVKPSATTDCTYLCQPSWSTGDWSPPQCPQAQVISGSSAQSASTSCTPVTRTRVATCLDAYGLPASDALCSSTAMPLKTDTCPLPPGCSPGDISASSTTSGMVPPDESVGVASSTGVDNPPSNSGSVDPLTIPIDSTTAIQIAIKYLLEPSELPFQFASTFASDVSSVLDISTSRVKVTSISAGSTVLQFLILPTAQSSDVSAKDAANAFQAAFVRPGSALLLRPSLQYADSSSGATLTLMHSCADGSYSAADCGVSSQTTDQTTTTNTGQTTVVANVNSSSSSRSWVLIVAVVASAVGVLLIIGLVCFCTSRHKMRQTKANDIEDGKTTSVVPSTVPSISTATDGAHPPHRVLFHVATEAASREDSVAQLQNQAMDKA